MRLIERGENIGVSLRLLGGVAVRLLCKDVFAEHPQLDRLCGDIDFAGLSENTKIIEEVLKEEGFKPHKEFNFLNVSSRMLFSKEGLKVDVILDEFRMNHRWPIRARLFPKQYTLPLEDLMLTKLQVVHLNRKDIVDLLSLGLKSIIEPPAVYYITGLCLKSWGFTHTVLTTCNKLVTLRKETLIDNLSNSIAVYNRIAEEIRRAKKPLAWQIRAIFGERLRWYEVAEEPFV